MANIKTENQQIPVATEENEGLKAFRNLRAMAEAGSFPDLSTEEIDEVIRASRGETETEARRKGWEAFLQMRKMAIANGAADMSLEEINKEISAARNG